MFSPAPRRFTGSRIHMVGAIRSACACFFGCLLALIGGSTGIATAKKAPGAIQLAAQPSGKGANRGVIAAGLVRAKHVRIQSAQGCGRRKLTGSGAVKRRFAVFVSADGERCLRGTVRKGWVRVRLCASGDCVERQVRVLRRRDRDREGLDNFLERGIFRTSPSDPDTDGDTFSDRYEVMRGYNPRNPASPRRKRSPGAAPAPSASPSSGFPPKPPCMAGSTNVTSAAAVRSEVAAGRNVCVIAAIGDLDLKDLGNRAGVVVSTEHAGAIGSIDLGGGTTDLTIRGAVFRSIEMRGADRTMLQGNIIGGTPGNRVLDQLILMPDRSDDVTIRENDMGWTRADDSGNTGYGCRCYGTLNRLQFVGNRIHDIAADGFQGVDGDDVLIDRNEIGPVGANSDSSEHSDNIQITGNGANLRITNNWIHRQGYFDGGVTGNSGSVYIHGGETDPLLFENNLIQIAQGRTEICGLGTGGTARSNITIRGNTWIEGGLAFSGFPGFEWDCDSGTGNVVERNIAVDPDGGFAQSGGAGAATFLANIWGQPSLVALDGSGNCLSANCNPPGQAPIGYRRPAGAHW